MPQPNILVFMADQMLGDVSRPDHPCITPNMERLAAQGVRFENTFCTAPHCCPSRASFFTGQMPSVHGVWNNVSNRCAISRGLNEGVATLGEILGPAGYNLGFSGKWHVSDFQNPSDLGWTEYALTAPKDRWQHSRIEMYDEASRRPAAPHNPRDIRRPGWGEREIYGPMSEEEHRNGNDVNTVAQARRAIEELAAKGGPWCVFASCTAPHDTYQVPQRYLDLYEGMDVPLPASFSDDLKDKPRIYQRMRRQYWDQLSPDQTREAIKHYWAMCSMVDGYLGELLDTLDRTGQAENTIVVFTSDHGDYTGAHGIWCKGVPSFREAYAIPGIVRWPAATKDPGRTVSDLVSVCDFFPTFVEAATGKAPDVFGDSLLPFLRGERPEGWRDALFSQMNGVELYYTQRMVWTRQWKYVYNGFDFDEMYDLESDPGETVNLADPERYDQSVPERGGEYVPWPRMTPELEAVREEMYGRLWAFACEQQDHFIYTPYLTTAQATYGPALAVK